MRGRRFLFVTVTLPFRTKLADSGFAGLRVYAAPKYTSHQSSLGNVFEGNSHG